MSVSLGKIITCYLVRLGLLKRGTYYRCFNNIKILKVQSCKLYDSKHIIASTQIINAELFAFIAAILFKLLRRKVLSINRKYIGKC